MKVLIYLSKLLTLCSFLLILSCSGDDDVPPDMTPNNDGYINAKINGQAYNCNYTPISTTALNNYQIIENSTSIFLRRQVSFSDISAWSFGFGDDGNINNWTLPHSICTSTDLICIDGILNPSFINNTTNETYTFPSGECAPISGEEYIFTITINSYTGERIAGTFEGILYKDGCSNGDYTPYDVTEGSFDLPIGPL